MSNIATELSLEERVKALKEMLDKERHFSESMFQSAPIAIVGISPDNKVLMVNSKAEELFRKPKENILGTDLSDVLPGADPYINGGLNMTLQWEESAICWKSSIIKNESGAIAGAMLFGMTFEMVSSGTIWSERMEAIQSFVGALAHDLNNLLGAIAGYSSLVQSFSGTEEKMLTYLKALDSSIKRVSEITSKSMKFAQSLKPSKQPFDLNDRLLTLSKKWSAKKPNIIIETAFTSSESKMEADWLMIEEALVALLDNASEAMPKGGKVRIATEIVTIGSPVKSILNYPKPGRYVKIAVEDTGEGMNSTTIPKAFMPFYSTRDKGKGSGMGLTIAYAHIKQNNGYLTLESQKGNGTTASVYLPVQSKHGKVSITDISPEP